MNILLPSDAVLSVRRTTRQDSVALKVTVARNTLLVPRQFTDKKIHRFIEEQLSWIEQTIQKQRLRLPSSVPVDDSQVVLRYGQVYQIVYDSSVQICIWQGESEQVLIPERLQNQPGLVKIELQKHLFDDIALHLHKRCHHWAKQMGVVHKMRGLQIKDYRSRWGSCTHDGRLQFNWRLVFFAPEVIDYVIVHELAHLTHLNHSTAFWGEVAAFCPEYKKHQATLKHQAARAMAF